MKYLLTAGENFPGSAGENVAPSRFWVAGCVFLPL